MSEKKLYIFTDNVEGRQYTLSLTEEQVYVFQWLYYEYILDEDSYQFKQCETEAPLDMTIWGQDVGKLKNIG